MTISVQRRRVAFKRRSFARSQATVYRPDSKYYLEAEPSVSVTEPETPFSMSISLYLISLSQLKSVFASGYSFTHAQRNFSVEIAHSTGRLDFDLQGDGEIKTHSYSTTLKAGQWYDIILGWTGGQAFIDVDGVREYFDHPKYVAVSNAQKFTFGNPGGSLNGNWEFYNLRVALDSGNRQIYYPCEFDTDGVCVNTNAGSAGEGFDAIIRLSGGAQDPNPTLAVSPIKDTPEPPDPEPGVYDEFTASSSDPSATFTWEVNRHSVLNTNYYPASTLSNASELGDNNEILRIDSAVGTDAGLVRPRAHTALYVDGKTVPPGEEATLIVIDDDEPPVVEQPGVPSIAFTDLTSGPRTGWDDSSGLNKGAAITVWGFNLGTSGTRGTDYIKVGSDANGWVTLDNDGHYPETWAQYDAPIPWMQSICFHLTGDMALDPAASIVAVIGGEESNALPIGVRDTGTISFVDFSQGTPGSGTGTYADPYHDMQAFTGNWKRGDVVYLRGGTRTTSLQPNSGTVNSFIRVQSGEHGTEAEPIAVVGYPGDRPIMTFNSQPGESPGGPSGFKYGALSRLPWVTFAKMAFNTDCASVYVKSEGAVGGWNRVVGCDAMGNYKRDSGNGIMNFTKGFRDDESQDSGHRVLGCRLHGIQSCDRYDHAIYFAGQPKDEGCEAAYNYIYDNHIGRGSLISCNHQADRVAPGEVVRSHLIHHNYINGVTPPEYWPPSHDPRYEDKYTDAKHDARVSCPVGLANDGSSRDGVESGDPWYVYNNVLIGTGAAPPPDTPDTPQSLLGGGELLRCGATAGGIIFNNVFLNWWDQAIKWELADNATKTDGSPIDYRFINNVFYLEAAEIEDGAGNYYSKDIQQPGNSHTNAYFGGNEASIKGSRIFESPGIEPDFVIDDTVVPFVMQWPSESLYLGQGFRVTDPNVLRDINGALYDISPMEPGAFDFVPDPVQEADDNG